MAREDKLTDWVRLKHAGQVIRQSGKPYFDHLEAVAATVAPVTPMGYEIGLCHDLLEKTQTPAKEFYEALIRFRYHQDEAEYIVNQVIELTDVFSKAAYPALNKSIRKEKEKLRLMTISNSAQTVKYADLIYNIGWMMTYDRAHAEYYLKGKKSLLTVMKEGDSALYQKAIKLINECLIISGFGSDVNHEIS